MLTPTLDTVRVFLHVLSATVWVGGQITLLVLLPTVREIGGDAPKLTARAFNPAAWVAYGGIRGDEIMRVAIIHLLFSAPGPPV